MSDVTANEQVLSEIFQGINEEENALTDAQTPAVEAEAAPEEVVEGGEDGEEEAVEAASEEGEAEEVEAEEVVEEPVRKSKAQERIRELAAERKALREQLDAQTQQLQQQQAAQQQAFYEQMQAMQQQNAALAQQMQEMLASKNRGEEVVDPIEEKLQPYLKKYIDPLKQELAVSEQKRLEAIRHNEERKALEKYKQEAFLAANKHVLEGMSTEQKADLADQAYELTLAMARVHGKEPEEAAKLARDLFEKYHQVRTAAKKAVVKAKVVESKKSAVVLGSQGRVQAKETLGVNASVADLLKAGYSGNNAVDILFEANKDGYRKLK